MEDANSMEKFAETCSVQHPAGKFDWPFLRRFLELGL